MTPDGDDASLPLEETIPAPIYATPSQVVLGTQDHPMWWQPGWRDIKHLVGWRWVLLIPAILTLLLFAGGWYFVPLRGIALAFGVKLGLVVIAFSVSLAGWVTRMAMKARTEPFCIYCGYSLTGLPDHYKCPECGRPYTHALIAEYRKDPHWFVERWKQSQRTPEPPTSFESGPMTRRRRAKDGTE